MATDNKIPRFATNEHPVQRFLWSDYNARPYTAYEFLLIRGDTRVADICLTEFNRIFRDFCSRDVINEMAEAAKVPKTGKLAACA